MEKKTCQQFPIETFLSHFFCPVKVSKDSFSQTGESGFFNDSWAPIRFSTDGFQNLVLLRNTWKTTESAH